MESWKKALMYAAGAGGVAAVLWWLLREDPEGQAGESGAAAPEEGDKKKGGQGPVSAEDLKKEQVVLILDQMIESQERMKVHMKEITVKLIEKDMDFEETYEQVRSVQPDDPLERHGLSMAEFDKLLTMHQADPQVMQGLTRIMGMGDSSAPGKQKPMTEAQVIAVHAFMLQELENLTANFLKIKGKKPWDMKTVTLASQAVVGAKVEKKYSFTSEDIELAVMQHHTVLATNKEFAEISQKMQGTMTMLMGAPPG
jgi:hypothetical protein